jgi:hypothetical protein
MNRAICILGFLTLCLTPGPSLVGADIQVTAVRPPSDYYPFKMPMPMAARFTFNTPNGNQTGILVVY